MRIRLVFAFLLLLALLPIPSKVYATNTREFATSAVLRKAVVPVEADTRIRILRDYLAQYNSPLVSSSQTFIKAADKYNIDWRLVASISGVESTFAQQLPYNSYNAWGWGIYGDNMIYFNSYDEAIETISKSLREKYMDKWGAQDVYQIGRFYAASEMWPGRVAYFMNKINDFAISNPSYSLSISL